MNEQKWASNILFLVLMAAEYANLSVFVSFGKTTGKWILPPTTYHRHYSWCKISIGLRRADTISKKKKRVDRQGTSLIYTNIRLLFYLVLLNALCVEDCFVRRPSIYPRWMHWGALWIDPGKYKLNCYGLGYECYKSQLHTRLIPWLL